MKISCVDEEWMVEYHRSIEVRRTVAMEIMSVVFDGLLAVWLVLHFLYVHERHHEYFFVEIFRIACDQCDVSMPG